MGVFMAFSGIMGLLAFSAMPSMPRQLPHAADMPQGFASMMSMFRYFGWFIVAQLGLAALAVVSGIQFLKLRPWARTALEILSWISLIYVVGFGVFWLAMWSTITGQFPQQDTPVDMGTFKIVGLIMGVFVTLIFAVPLAIMIKYLRGKVVRESMLAASTARRD